MSMFGGIFKRANRAPSSDDTRAQFSHPNSPQYTAGITPAGTARQEGFTNYVRPSHPAIVTAGFDDCGCDASAQLNYGLREQPDVGGALNYAYENYGLPLVQPAGAFQVARHPFHPIGAPSMQVWPVSVPTGAGLFPGQVISQPLLNPQGPDTGYDIYN